MPKTVAFGSNPGPGEASMSKITNTITQTVTLGSAGFLSPLTVTSTGAIEPTTAGATALYVPTSVVGASIANDGHIAGANGVQERYFGARGGNGGTGVALSNSGTLKNAGIISGGDGGDGHPFFAHETVIGGNGGDGVDLTSGGTLINTGFITGGGGGSATGNAEGGAFDGAGGAGVYLNGGALITSGTITGGAGGNGFNGVPGPAGDAVQFGTTAATLVIDPGAVFNGQVVANASAADVLQLAGTAAGTLSGLGTQFTNFNSIDVNAGAKWTLSGANSLTSTSTLTIGNSGNLTIGGSLGGAGTLALDASSVVDATGALGTAHSGGHETLMLGKPASFTGTIAGFGVANTYDAIDLSGIAATKISYTDLSASSGVLTVTDNAVTIAALHFSGGNYQTSEFHFAVVGGGTHITFG
jgi:hypothetical protein